MRWLFLLLAVACSLPLLVADLVPGVDYPMHLSYARFLRLALTDPAYRELLGTRLFQPYWGFNGPVLALSALVPLEVAGKIVLGAALLAPPLAIHRLARQEGLSPALALPAFALSYNISFYWGFAAFLVGTGVALLGLPSLLRLARAPRPRTLLLVHLIALATFACHLLSFCFFLAWALWIFLAAGDRRARSLLLAGTLLLPAGILLVIWRARLEVWGNLAITMSNPVFEPFGRKASQLPEMLFPTGNALFGWSALALLALIVTLALRGVDARAERRRLLVFGGLAGFMLLGYALLPQDLAGIHFLFERFLVFALLFLPFCAARSPRHPRLIVALSLLLSLGVSAQHVWNVQRIDRELAGARACLTRLEPRTRLLGLMVQRDSEVVPIPLLLHLDNYHSVWNLGRVPTHPMEVLSAAPVYFRAPLPREAIPPFFEWVPLLFDYPRMGRGLDYFLVHGPELLPTPVGPVATDLVLFKTSIGEVRKVCEAGRFRVYENRARATSPRGARGTPTR